MVGSNILPPDKKILLPDLNTVATTSDDDHDSQTGDECDSVHGTEETSTESGTTSSVSFASSSRKGSIAFDLNLTPPEEPEDDVDPAPVEAGKAIRRRRKKTKLTDEMKQAIYDALMERTAYGKLVGNATEEVAELFSVHIRTVQRIWKIAKDTPFGEPVDVCGKKQD